MTIKIQCPVCNASNQLTPDACACRRCSEDLSLLYSVKGYSMKYRLWLLQWLSQPQSPQFRQLLNTATRLCREG